MAEIEGISVEAAVEWTDVDPADRAAITKRFGHGGLVDVAEVTRLLAQRHGLTAAETAQAVGQAERCHALLEARAKAERWA